MLFRISSLLDKLDNSRDLVMGKYYYHFATYNVITQRRRILVLRKHLEISNTIFKISYIFKVKLNAKLKVKEKVNSLKKYIINTHNNIGNIPKPNTSFFWKVTQNNFYNFNPYKFIMSKELWINIIIFRDQPLSWRQAI